MSAVTWYDFLRLTTPQGGIMNFSDMLFAYLLVSTVAGIILGALLIDDEQRYPTNLVCRKCFKKVNFLNQENCQTCGWEEIEATKIIAHELAHAL